MDVYGGLNCQNTCNDAFNWHIACWTFLYVHRNFVMICHGVECGFILSQILRQIFPETISAVEEVTTRQQNSRSWLANAFYASRQCCSHIDVVCGWKRWLCESHINISRSILLNTSRCWSNADGRYCIDAIGRCSADRLNQFDRLQLEIIPPTRVHQIYYWLTSVDKWNKTKKRHNTKNR